MSERSQPVSEAANERYRDVFDAVDCPLLILDADRRIESANPPAFSLLGYARSELEGLPLARILSDSCDFSPAADEAVAAFECALLAGDGARVPVHFSAKPLLGGGWVCSAEDLRVSRQQDLKVSQAQKLESIGQLASGIAHEINTPIQFVGDSAHFLGEAYEDLDAVLAQYRTLRDAVAAGRATEGLLEKIAEAEVTADVEFLAEEVPGALRRTLDGVERVASIVRALKEFSHPGDAEQAPADLNGAIRTTLTVGRNEYKYVAELVTDLGDIPDVVCNVGDVNQVILNLIVNAAHAIGDNGASEDALGRISLGTRLDEDHVVVEVKDTGGGVPAEIRGRIFDPFFTTKDVGRGSGQGLALAHAVVVDQHRGELSLDVEEGVGSTFTIRLPVAGLGA